MHTANDFEPKTKESEKEVKKDAPVPPSKEFGWDANGAPTEEKP